MHIPQNFLPKSRQKLLRSAPGQSFPVVAVMPLAAKVLKQVMVNTGGNKRQVPAKRQNRGSRNSTDDGGKKQRCIKDGQKYVSSTYRWLYS
ncbi:single-stranded DNA-binding protein [Escherichia coli]|uniref:single-stranded DNA-binding protein n=2 Tax=Escherichia coli TaxID=562 RepID=UPI00346486AE